MQARDWNEVSVSNSPGPMLCWCCQVERPSVSEPPKGKPVLGSMSAGSSSNSLSMMMGAVAMKLAVCCTAVGLVQLTEITGVNVKQISDFVARAGRLMTARSDSLNEVEAGGGLRMMQRSNSGSLSEQSAASVTESV